MNDAHSDAPYMDEIARALHTMVWAHAPVEEVRAFLIGEFNASARVMYAPTYKQPNGFWTFKLGRDVDAKGNERLLRLHYWPEGLQGITETGGLHDHVFGFTSLVLAGREPLINNHYELKRDPNSRNAVYEVVNISPTEQVVRKLSEGFSPVSTRRDLVPPGNYYDFPANAFHTSRIMNDAEAITLMATRASPFNLHPRFIAASDLPVLPEYKRAPLSLHQRTLVSQRLEYGF